jgi:hypothetical protein
MCGIKYNPAARTCRGAEGHKFSRPEHAFHLPCFGVGTPSMFDGVLHAHIKRTSENMDGVPTSENMDGVPCFHSLIWVREGQPFDGFGRASRSTMEFDSPLFDLRCLDRPRSGTKPMSWTCSFIWNEPWHVR